MKFILQFRKSKSKYYQQAEKLARDFSGYTFNDNVNRIELNVKEVFEMWDSFNDIFWKVVDWKYTTFGYDGYNIQSHSDKTRLFYALQWAHATWMNMSSDYLKNIAHAYYDQRFEDIEKMKVMIDYNTAEFPALIEKAFKIYGKQGQNNCSATSENRSIE